MNPTPREPSAHPHTHALSMALAGRVPAAWNITIIYHNKIRRILMFTFGWVRSARSTVSAALCFSIPAPQPHHFVKCLFPFCFFLSLPLRSKSRPRRNDSKTPGAASAACSWWCNNWMPMEQYTAHRKPMGSDWIIEIMPLKRPGQAEKMNCWAVWIMPALINNWTNLSGRALWEVQGAG